jgi:hypothetical protein
MTLTIFGSEFTEEEGAALKAETIAFYKDRRKADVLFMALVAIVGALAGKSPEERASAILELIERLSQMMPKKEVH